MDDKKKKVLKDIGNTCIMFVAALFVAWFLVSFVAQRTVVDGESMCTTLNDGDNLIVEKLSYLFGDVDRYDVVVFPYTKSNGQEVYYIKRVIGLPNEFVEIIDGTIYINGEELEEDYGYYYNDAQMNGYEAEEGIQLGDNEYFVLGDNRNNSVDSRKIGAITEDEIVGRAMFRIYPFGDFGFID